MVPITFTWYDNTTGASNQQTFQALKVKGFDPVDDLEEFPGVQFVARGSGLVQQNILLRRHFTIELGTLQVYADRLFVGNFMHANRKVVTYSYTGIGGTAMTEYAVVVVNENQRLQTEWLDRIEIARYVVIQVQEAYAQAQFPSGVVPVSDTDMYVKKMVKIVGVPGSPEVFTTNAGKLASCDAPAGAYPGFNASTQVFSIDVDGSVYQDCHFNIVADATVVSGNLQFSVAQSGAGSPSGDGFYYCDITIFAVNK
jgi:hypothetical protein